MATELLPCVNDPAVVAEVEPTVRLLTTLDTAHPEVLLQAGIQPAHYHEGSVFRSAVETIRGGQAAGHEGPRQGLVGRALAAMQEKGLVVGFERTGRGVRWDFDVTMDAEPERLVGIEVKGGEGNSLNLCNRPPHVAEFVIWSHLDGSIGHDPPRGARAVLTRVVADIVRAPKHIDALVIRDAFCGTLARPCPKYPLRDYTEMGPAPDIFLLPRRVPVFGRDMQPGPHSAQSCVFPFRLLRAYGVPENRFDDHVHYVDIRLYYAGEVPMREVTVKQGGQVQFTHVTRHMAR